MGHFNPLLWTVYLIRLLNKEISTLLIPIGIMHILHEPKSFLPCSKVIYPLGQDNVLRSIALEELVQRKLMIPTTQTTPQNLNSYENPPSIWSNLADGQSKKINHLTVQYRQWQS